MTLRVNQSQQSSCARQHRGNHHYAATLTCYLDCRALPTQIAALYDVEFWHRVELKSRSFAQEASLLYVKFGITRSSIALVELLAQQRLAVLKSAGD